MSIRERLARMTCVILHGGHDTVPLAPVIHIGLAQGVEIESESHRNKRVCRRCWFTLEDGLWTRHITTSPRS